MYTNGGFSKFAEPGTRMNLIMACVARSETFRSSELSGFCIYLYAPFKPHVAERLSSEWTSYQGGFYHQYSGMQIVFSPSRLTVAASMLRGEVNSYPWP